jgi:arylsulfatase
MLGHRAIYHDGWRAVCPVPGPSFTEAGMGFGQTEITRQKLIEMDFTGWELYHVEEDWAENHNLAADHRDKLVELIATWYVEAGKFNVLPVDSRGIQRFAEDRPQLTRDRETYTYYPGTSAAPDNAAVKVLNRPHTIKTQVEIQAGNGEGVLVSQGTASGGYTLFVKDHRLRYVHNYVGVQEFEVVAEEPLTDGQHELGFEFKPTAPPEPAQGIGTPGIAELFVDGRLVGRGEIPKTVPLSLGLGGGLLVGRSQGAAVSSAYTSPFEFTGTIREVVVDVSGEHIEDEEARMKTAMARQ